MIGLAFRLVWLFAVGTAYALAFALLFALWLVRDVLAPAAVALALLARDARDEIRRRRQLEVATRRPLSRNAREALRRRPGA